MVTTKQATASAEHIYIRLDQLRFDPANPRLPSSIDGSDDSAVLEWMLDDATIIELMRSIGENGYFDAEPLWVVKAKGNKDIYEVVEGNRRLAALMLLDNPKLAPIKKQAVLDASNEAKIPIKDKEFPAVVYPDSESIQDYLGYRHITGIKPWGSLAKAKYLDRLRQTLKEKSQEKQFQSLAKTIGSNSPYVGRLLTSLALYERMKSHDFFRLKGVDEQSIKFSLITTALLYSNIVQFLGLSSTSDPSLKKLVDRHLEELTEWMFQRDAERTTRLGESRNLGKLNAVVGSKAALDAFRNGSSLDDASLLTGVPTEVFRLSVAKAKGHLQNASDYIHKAKDATEADVAVLADIEDLAAFLHSSLQNVLTKKPNRKTGTDNR